MTKMDVFTVPYFHMPPAISPHACAARVRTQPCCDACVELNAFAALATDSISLYVLEPVEIHWQSYLLSLVACARTHAHAQASVHSQ
jgi:hypothetical protein